MNENFLELNVCFAYYACACACALCDCRACACACACKFVCFCVHSFMPSVPCAHFFCMICVRVRARACAYSRVFVG